MKRILLNTGSTFFVQMKTKLKFGSDGIQHVWHRLGQEYRSDCIVPTVKHGGQSVLIWGCMSAKGVGEMTFIDGTMNASLYIQILNEKMTPSVKKVVRREMIRRDNDSKHTRVFKDETMTWPSMSADLNPIKHL